MLPAEPDCVVLCSLEDRDVNTAAITPQRGTPTCNHISMERTKLELYWSFNANNPGLQQANASEEKDLPVC